MRAVVRFVPAMAAAAAFAAACYVGPVEQPRDTPSTAAPTDPAGTSSSGGAPIEGEEGNGLPCDVDELLEKSCRGCHGSPPAKAPMALVTYEDLAAAPKSGMADTNAVAAIMRMRDAESPMPPSGQLPSPSIVVLEKWVAAGMPRGTCGGAPSEAKDAGPDRAAPPEPKSVCTSGTLWNSTRRGTTMNPGRACITCHESVSDDGPIVQIGGTVYPTVREPDLCYGVDGTTTPTTVVITDANGQVFNLPVGATGNFALRTGTTTVTPPFRAKVVQGGKERAMSKAQTSGDCNSCHTETGANGAPGRIFLP